VYLGTNRRLPAISLSLVVLPNFVRSVSPVLLPSQVFRRLLGVEHACLKILGRYAVEEEIAAGLSCNPWPAELPVPATGGQVQPAADAHGGTGWHDSH